MGSNYSCDLKYARTSYKNQSFNDVTQKLASGMINFDAKAAEVGRTHYKPLMDFRNFGSFVTHKLRLAANAHSYDSLFNHWYIRRREFSYGPFSLLQMLEFFQQNRITLDTLVRHSSYDQWEKFGSAGPFEVHSLEKLISHPEIREVICRRRHPRIKYDNEVFISSQGELYRGVSWSLSVGGLGVVTDSSTDINLHDRVNIIINSNNHHGSVQMKGRIVHLTKELNCEKVALKFDRDHEFLNKFIEQRVPALELA